MEDIPLGKRIAQRRKELGYSQEQLARLLCISHKTVSSWECGRGCPSLSFLLHLSKILELESIDLFL
ncbi:helix-turn-helix transcriptional regulator [Oribacterium sinus]|uniref:helix-turn-helix transcriptional regulator n=1 Tax=Oribacterium sinus TaxID=237576 RepID=UPI003FA5DA2D